MFGTVFLELYSFRGRISAVFHFKPITSHSARSFLPQLTLGRSLCLCMTNRFMSALCSVGLKPFFDVLIKYIVLCDYLIFCITCKVHVYKVYRRIVSRIVDNVYRVSIIYTILFVLMFCILFFDV